jgi:ribonuclease D
VIQLASDDEAVAVDALAEGLDMTPVFELMANEAVVKVFHAARQDIEIVWNLAKMVPAPLFDTQVAAMVCGFGDQVSYGELVQAVCKIPVDKSSRFTDWSRRPLTEAQVAYALADVTHLRDVYRSLRARLDKSGRTGWLADEMQTLTSVSTYEQHPDNAWERLRNRAERDSDLPTERVATLRLAQLLTAHGELERGRGFLVTWIERDPRDAEPLYLLCDLDESISHWDGVSAAATRLAYITEVEAQVNAPYVVPVKAPPPPEVDPKKDAKKKK